MSESAHESDGTRGVLRRTIRSPHAAERGADGFFHPASEEELCALVRFAGRHGCQLRVRGSAHSIPRAIYTEQGAPLGVSREHRAHVDVMLDRYRAVEFDDASRRVTVQAGCHLGLDPRDPTGTSTWANSLTARLDARGWALPDLGGVTHQTVAGFLLTGSCGGTVQHDIEASVISLRLIDGNAEVHTLQRGRDELFDAALCSLGLLGVVSTITFQCIERYDIIGREDITHESECDYGLFSDGAEGIEGLLRRAEYSRVMWWPQHGVRQVVTWQARRMQRADYSERTGQLGALRPKRYYALGEVGLSPAVTSLLNQGAQAAGGLFYDALAQASRLNATLPIQTRLRVRERARQRFARQLLPAVLKQFVSAGKTQHFWDTWYEGLPLDNQMSERSLPTDFTEIWLPLERAGEVMRTLREHYDRVGYEATGAFICELYASHASSSWLHPGYGRDSFRVDVFWFRRNSGDPRRGYFLQFWKLLQSFGYRLHWGKYLPLDPALGSHHLRANTPRWDDFLRARAQLDPGQVFLTPYWRSVFEVAAR